MSNVDESRTPAECRAKIVWRLGRDAAWALRRLEEKRPAFPKLPVLPEDRARVVAAYEGGCAYCGGEIGEEDGTDFLVPETRGGTDQCENLVAACATCALERRGRHLDAFLARRIDLDRARVYARIARATARMRADADRRGVE
jgi:hypothetical protein